MTTILGIDPGGTPPALASLSPAQCANLAMEILWSQPNPLPTPPEALENMYNQPPNTGVPGDQHEQNRQQFEGALNSYYSTTDANAQRLSNYVYAVAAAFQCQQISQGSPQPVTRALFELPVNAGQPSSGPLGEVQVLLVSTTAGGALPVSFGIPATYFYALGATLPPQVNAAQRYQLATGDLPARLLAQLTDAVNSGVIADAVSATELGFGVSPNINPAQAVRRLGALSPGNSTATPPCPMTPAVVTIVNDWLNFGLDWPDATAHTLDQFWSGEASAQATDYLEFVLDALTEGYAPSPAASLATLIQQNLTFNNPPQAVTSVADLAQASTSDWSHFFNNPPAGLTTAQLLPPFTGGGNNLARIAAFIRMVQQFFTVLPPAPPASFSAGAANAPATLALPSTDWLSQAISAYQTLSGTVVTLGNGFDPTLLASAAAQVFPDDAGAQAWLVNALTMLDTLAALVNPLPIGGSDPAAVRFSIMEGLYARGLVSRSEIQALTLADFQAALTGTLAYDYASALYAAAGGAGGPPVPVPVPGPVTPVNPGNLVNCVPPPCRSPLGAIEYLHELLALAETASCVDPLAAPASGHGVLGDALATRRGPLAQLLASCANLEIPLPLIDIVNECLESLATTIPSPAQGAVYNTDGEHLAGYDLCHVECCPPDDADKERGCHDPAELYQTLPAWSSPAVPVALPQAYTLLASDFSAPDLPYSQVLDINRSYLVHLRSSRYALLRRFRREITSFVHDPALGAPTFQTQLWRYPLSDDLSAEYLCLSPQEAALFSADSKIQPWQLYGFAAKSDGDTVWTQVVGKVSEFLARTGLSYCELLALQQSGLVAFQARTSTDDQEGDGKLPDCEPCYPDRWQLDFGRANLSALTRLALYIRLWRKLQCREGVHLRFSDLADIVAVLMPAGGTPDTDFLRQLAALLLLCEVYHLPLIHPHEKTTGTGSARLHLLAFWVGPTDPKWDWALQQLLHGVGRHAGQQHRCDARAPQFIKLLHDDSRPAVAPGRIRSGDRRTHLARAAHLHLAFRRGAGQAVCLIVQRG